MDSEATADVLASLNDLFEQSRSAAGRAALAEAGRPRALAGLLPAALDACVRERSGAAADQLLCILRTLRNSCAGVADAKEQLHDACCAEHLARLLCVVAGEPALEQRSLLLATALQVLGNSSVQHARNQEATWCAPSLVAPCGPCTDLRRARAACFPAAFNEAAGKVGAQPKATRSARPPEAPGCAQVLRCTRRCAWCCSSAAVSSPSACLSYAVGRGRISWRVCWFRVRRR